jgi:hypothetical protein
MIGVKTRAMTMVTFSEDGPRATRTRRATMMRGSARITSRKRERMASSQPPA